MSQTPPKPGLRIVDGNKHTFARNALKAIMRGDYTTADAALDVLERRASLSDVNQLTADSGRTERESA